MSDIDFLNENNRQDEKKSGAPSGQPAALAWSEPEKEKKTDSPKSPFSFLPFLDKKKKSTQDKSSSIDKEKIKQSRQEILKLIRRHEEEEAAEEQATAKKNNLLSSLGERLKKPAGHKEILIDYQQVFNKEKGRRGLPFMSGREPARPLSRVGKVLDAPAPEPAQDKAKPPKISREGWFKIFWNSLKEKISAWRRPSGSLGKVNLIKGDLLEEEKKKPANKIEEIKRIEPAEIKAEQPAPVEKKILPADAPGVEQPPKMAEKRLAERFEPVIETNLIKGEIITFFDWSSKIPVLAVSILLPVFLVGGAYLGVLYYKNTSQANIKEQEQKYAQLSQDIKAEKDGLAEAEIFQAKMKIISPIFSQHIYWSNFFKFLEDYTIKDVYFLDFSGDTAGVYDLGAMANNYNNIAEQIKVFKGSQRIKEVSAEGGETSGGDKDSQAQVKFNLKFTIDNNIFTE